MNIEYKENKAKVVFVPYIDSKNTSIQIIDPNTNRIMAIATSNLEVQLPKQIVLLKKQSEVITDLINANVIDKQKVGEYKVNNKTLYAYELTEKGNKNRIKQYRENQYDSVIK